MAIRKETSRSKDFRMPDLCVQVSAGISTRVSATARRIDLSIIPNVPFAWVDEQTYAAICGCSIKTSSASVGRGSAAAIAKSTTPVSATNLMISSSSWKPSAQWELRAKTRRCRPAEGGRVDGALLHVARLAASLQPPTPGTCPLCRLPGRHRDPASVSTRCATRSRTCSSRRSVA